MSFRSVLVALVLLATAAVAAMNWGAFTAPTALTLGFTTITAPIGAVMLGALGLVALIFLAWVVRLQSSVLLDSRRQARELQAQRELADKAEASRFTELRQFMSAELSRVAQASDSAQQRILARIEQLEQRQRVVMEQTGNTLSGYLGEMESRLARREVVIRNDAREPRDDARELRGDRMPPQTPVPQRFERRP